MKAVYFIFLLLFITSLSSAQKQNKNWCFGWGFGLSFNTSSPSTFASSARAGEGCATISDRNTGDLLFYTDGVSCYDRTHTIMPNGYMIGTDTGGTSAQGAIIIPDPADSNQYYVFTLQHTSENGDIRYSIVDMTLNGGKGDIIKASKYTLLNTGMAEGMTTTYACDGQWLILYKRNAESFYSYKINASGVNPQPVISKVNAPFPTKGMGSIKVSPDGKTLVLVSYDYSYSGYWGFVSINDFEMKNGRVSNLRILENIPIDSAYYTHECASEYSPDGSKLYISSMSDGEIHQYDLSLQNISAIKASKRLVYKSNDAIGSLQIGPDSNIYVAYVVANFLDKISNTNLAYPSCTFTHRAIVYSRGNIMASLPQPVLERKYGVAPTYTGSDTSGCMGDVFTFKGRANENIYAWNNGTTDSILTVNSSGTYWVRSGPIIGCGETVDTFNVTLHDLDFDLGLDTVICKGEELLLAPKIADSTIKYRWQDNSEKGTFTVNKDGKYYLTVSTKNCSNSDTINIAVNSDYIFDLGNDSTLCKGNQLSLSIQSNLDSYLWSTGNTTNTIVIDTAGTYSLETNHKGCHYSDSIIIDYIDPSFSIGNDTTVCEGIPITLQAKSLEGSIYSWSESGFTGDNFTVSKTGNYYAIAENICGLTSDTIKITYKLCACNPIIPTAFTPNNDGLNDFFRLRVSCPVAKYHLTIINRFGQVVFESNDVNNSWDGRFKGKTCDMGTYFYLLRITNNLEQTQMHKGEITLLR